LGRIQVERQLWDNAKDWLLKVLDIEPDDVLSLYYLGKIYRETGKYKAFVLRRRDWARSDRYFSAVIQKDSTYADVLYQYASLQRYRKRFYQAVELAERQVFYKPDFTDGAVGMYEFYDALLFYQNDDEVKPWLSQRPGPRAKLFIGEIYRRNENFKKADSIFQILLNNPQNMSAIPLRLYAARLKAQQDLPQKCQDLYFQAVDSVKSFVDAALIFENIKYVLSDEELYEYQQMTSPDQWRDFFKKLWIKRNPMPAADLNLRLIKHFQRLVYAEKFFRWDGFRTWVNNPDKLHYLNYPNVFELNDKFNDKGLVYIRHGEPDDRAFDISENLVQNESWLYYRSGSVDRKLMFHFIIDEAATGNNWRLTAVLPQEMIESRLDWDPLFQKLYTGDALEILSLQLEMARQSRDNVMIGLNTDRHSWDKEIKPIFFPFHVVTFRGTEFYTRYEVYYGLRYNALWENNKNYDPDENISLGFAVYDMDMNELAVVHKKVISREVKQSSDSLGIWSDVFLFENMPERYNFSLYAELASQNKVGGYKFKYGVANYNMKTLMLSGIQLARNIRPENGQDRFVKNGLYIVPNPSRSFNKKERIYVYFEIYNLFSGEQDRVEYKIEYQFKLLKRLHDNVFSKLAGIFRNSKPRTSNIVERTSTTDTSIEYLALDMSRYDAGQYEFEIIVTVPATGDKVTRTTEFELK
ncbi:GWxTD domain-containing protein, partial [candidate division KSB1 bacterium]|nr:GWxTD domain-containing protein [candidate division KSB1 bacterium]